MGNGKSIEIKYEGVEPFTVEESMIDWLGKEKAILFSFLIDYSIDCIINGEIDELEYCKLSFEKVKSFNSYSMGKLQAFMKWFDEEGLIDLIEVTDKYWRFMLLMPWEQKQNSLQSFCLSGSPIELENLIKSFEILS